MIADDVKELVDALRALVELHGERDTSCVLPPEMLLPEEMQSPEIARAMRILDKTGGFYE